MTRSITRTIRLNDDEDELVNARARSFGMKISEYGRYALLNVSPPPQVTSSPPYSALVSSNDALVAQVNDLQQAFYVHESAFNTLASSDTNVAQALEQARTALGPGKENQ